MKKKQQGSVLIILAIILVILLAVYTTLVPQEVLRDFNSRLTEMDNYSDSHSEPLETTTPFWGNWSFPTQNP